MSIAARRFQRSAKAVGGGVTTVTDMLWPTNPTPAVLADTDTTAIELGTRFQVSQPANVTGVRFYKSSANTGTHTGSLWTNAGALLARVTFSGETASGWQKADFTTPVAISAGTYYVISYHTDTGRYSSDANYFATADRTSGIITAPKTSTASNGCYKYSTTAAFPDQTFNGTNYWVDVVVSYTSTPDLTPPSTPSGLTVLSTGSSWVTLKWTASTDNVGIDHYQVYRDGVPVGTTVSAGYTDGSLQPETSYVYTVRAYDTSNNSSGLSAEVTATTAVAGSSSWPDATNTGYRNAPGYPGTLQNGNGITIQSNQTYNFYQFNGCDVGNSSASVQNVTFNGCRFYGPSVGNALVLLYGDNITFNYCSFEPGVAAPPVPYNQSYQYGIAGNGGYNTHIQQLTVSHCDFWGFGNAIDTKGSTQAKPHLFEHNWIHDASDDNNGTYHTDGIGDESGSGLGSYVTISHNTIMSVGNTNGIAYQQGTYDHFTVTNNLLGGFGYTVAIWANTSTVFTGNVFDASTIPANFGPLYPQTFWTGGTSLWRNNTWQSTDSNNGKYWTPSGPSTTDYTG